MTVILICLGRSEAKEYAGILKLLDVLLSTETSAIEKCEILEEEFGMELTQELEREVSLMCNLSKGVEEKGIKKGMEKGMEKGKIYGMITAYRELNIADNIILQKLQEKFHLSEEEANQYLQETKTRIM